MRNYNGQNDKNYLLRKSNAKLEQIGKSKLRNGERKCCQFSDSGAFWLSARCLEVPEKRSPDLRFNWFESPPGVLLPGGVRLLPETSMSTTTSSDSLVAASTDTSLLGLTWLPGADFGVEPM